MPPRHVPQPQWANEPPSPVASTAHPVRSAAEDLPGHAAFAAEAVQTGWLRSNLLPRYESQGDEVPPPLPSSTLITQRYYDLYAMIYNRARVIHQL